MATEPFTRGLAGHARRHWSAIPGAIRRLRATTAVMAEFHTRYDVLLTPTVGHETPRMGWLDPTQPYDQLMARLREWVVFTPIANVTGLPAISLPLATTASGLPFGLMFSAAYGAEATLLELSYELEAAYPFPQMWNTF